MELFFWFIFEFILLVPVYCCFPPDTCYSKFRKLRTLFKCFKFSQCKLTGFVPVYHHYLFWMSLCHTTGETQGLPGWGSQFSKYKGLQSPVNTKPVKGQGAASPSGLLYDQLIRDPRVLIFLAMLTFVKPALKKKLT